MALGGMITHQTTNKGLGSILGVNNMNDDNLRPVRSKSVARERGRKGGKASGESKRRKKMLREAAIYQAVIDRTGNRCGESKPRKCDGADNDSKGGAGRRICFQCIVGASGGKAKRANKRRHRSEHEN